MEKNEKRKNVFEISGVRQNIFSFFIFIIDPILNILISVLYLTFRINYCQYQIYEIKQTFAKACLIRI